VVLVVISLAGAVVAMRYRHQVVALATHRKGSPTHTSELTTLPPGSQFHLAVAGDIGDSGSRLDRTAVVIAEIGALDPYDALLLLGDNVYPDGDPARLDTTVFGPFGPLLDDGTRLLAVLGNHDVKNGHGPGQLAALGMLTRVTASADRVDRLGG